MFTPRLPSTTTSLTRHVAAPSPAADRHLFVSPQNDGCADKTAASGQPSEHRCPFRLWPHSFIDLDLQRQQGSRLHDLGSQSPDYAQSLASTLLSFQPTPPSMMRPIDGNLVVTAGGKSATALRNTSPLTVAHKLFATFTDISEQNRITPHAYVHAQSLNLFFLTHIPTTFDSHTAFDLTTSNSGVALFPTRPGFIPSFGWFRVRAPLQAAFYRIIYHLRYLLGQISPKTAEPIYVQVSTPWLVAALENGLSAPLLLRLKSSLCPVHKDLLVLGVTGPEMESALCDDAVENLACFTAISSPDESFQRLALSLYFSQFPNQLDILTVNRLDASCSKLRAQRSVLDALSNTLRNARCNAHAPCSDLEIPALRSTACKSNSFSSSSDSIGRRL
ncbi:hypothetical protein PSPO01_09039 [Paraphaeosphaeria sporulosa]